MSASAPAYAAMMAIAATPDRTMRLAIFIGTEVPPTANPPPQWLVSFADANHADQWFKEGVKPPENAATIFDVPPPEFLSGWLTGGRVGVSDGSGAELEDRIMAAARMWRPSSPAPCRAVFLPRGHLGFRGDEAVKVAGR